MHYDLVIIGGGPGGYVAAIYAAKKKVKVALIEKAEVGGTCLNRGCIPTKSLIESANLFNKIKRASEFGIETENIKINWNSIQKRRESAVKTLCNGVKGLLKSNGVTIYNGEGTIISANTISISKDDEIQEITASKIIVATGSQPIIPPIVGSTIPGVITSDEALILEKIPESLLIVGGGVIGIELGYIYKALGSVVTIVEMLPELMGGRQDHEIEAALKRELVSQGINVYTNAQVEKIEQLGEQLLVTVKYKDKLEDVVAEKVLMATGRKTVTDVFGKLEVNVENNRIVVDDYLKTSVENIYAIGDVTGKIMLAHVASHQGIAAVKNALGQNEKMNYDLVPSCVYTTPEVASVGLTEKEALGKHNGKIKIGKFPFAANGKALTMGEIKGFVKIVADEDGHKILGAHIIGPKATELIAECALAMKMEVSPHELVETIHAHPTLSEATMEACFDLIGEPIHKL